MSNLCLYPYFPRANTEVSEQLVGVIFDQLKDSGDIECAGYAQNHVLYQDLSTSMGIGNIKQYKPLTDDQLAFICQQSEDIAERATLDMELP